MKLKKILVPVDFSDCAMEALEYAGAFAKRLGARLVVLYVVEPVYYATPSELYGPASNVALLLEEQRKVGAQQLAQIAARLRRRGIPAKTALHSGTPYQVIAEVAEKEKADLIVLGTHGRTGISHFVMGSVAERVVRSAPCPVLTVRLQPERPRSRKAPRSR